MTVYLRNIIIAIIIMMRRTAPPAAAPAIIPMFPSSLELLSVRNEKTVNFKEQRTKMALFVSWYSVRAEDR